MQIQDRNKELQVATISRFHSKIIGVMQDAKTLNSLTNLYKETIDDLSRCKQEYAAILYKYSVSKDTISVSTFPGIQAPTMASSVIGDAREDGEKLKELDTLLIQLEKQSAMVREQVNSLASRISTNLAGAEIDTDQLAVLLNQDIEAASNNGIYGSYNPNAY